MCGIVGYIGARNTLSVLIKGLKSLEYRGYDSAGVSFIRNGELTVIKKKGKVKELYKAIDESGYNLSESGKNSISAGIGHTRWATHGAPSDENSHPHLSMNGKICVVHNGIIENYAELRSYLKKKGYEFSSDTDTEVAAQLIEYYYTKGGDQDFEGSIRRALQDIVGSYALCVLCVDFPDKIICAKKDNPIVIGLGENENFIASDIPALIEYTRDVVFMEDNCILIMTKDSIVIKDVHGEVVDYEVSHVDWDADAAQKGGYAHFMMKEMFEEPKAFEATVAPRIKDGDIYLEHFPCTREFVSDIRSINIVACGTAYHAGCIGKYLIEKLCRIPVTCTVASEFIYSDPIIDEHTLTVVISQSGETLDTRNAMREAKNRGSKTLAIVNVIGSTIAREADHVLYTAAGPEISVASTKAYTTQLGCVYLLALKFAKTLGTITPEKYTDYQYELLEMPSKLKRILDVQDRIQRFASSEFNAESIFFIGRGLDYYLSMEASLKLKEISYIHSEAYAGGELKHGTIALIEDGTLVVSPITQDELAGKMESNIKEVSTRGATVLAIIPERFAEREFSCNEKFIIPDCDELFAPILTALPCQLFAYYMAVNKGCDIDKPRNLAKSVTVE
ncbi:MAG: glutamine--fructose-6-phosphate transaminase (isomerizing) [Clostridiales bacterium]|nr:glutamine--fructose-6-phosphate transaminase (isomerizing) [Clostridiales bacterium]